MNLISSPILLQPTTKKLSFEKELVTLFCSGVKNFKYPLFISKNKDFSNLNNFLRNRRKIFIIYDQIIADLFPNLLHNISVEQKILIPIKAEEKSKNFKNLENLLMLIIKEKPSPREDLVLIIGGGLVLNLGGLAASLMMRGLKYAFVPTTLTAQIDVCIGSKVAVNFNQAKNIIGLYNDPEFCYINSNFLSVIPKKEFNSQLIEGLKLCLATDRDLFFKIYHDISLDLSLDEISNKYLNDLINLKLAVLETDLMEQNYGMCMLYGHTIGHCIEILSEGNLNHGISVGLGMLIDSRISYHLSLADSGLVDIHKKTLKILNLPTKIPKSIKAKQIIDKLKYNKKNYRENCMFVLLSDVGQIVNKNGNYFQIVPEEVIYQSLRESY